MLFQKWIDMEYKYVAVVCCSFPRDYLSSSVPFFLECSECVFSLILAKGTFNIVRNNKLE